METNECYVYFAFDGEGFDPDEITKMLGIEPTSTKRKGERIPNQFPKFNSWQLSTKNIVNEIIDVDELASEVIQKLRSKVDLINEIKKVFNASTRLEVVLWITTDDNQSTPAIGFNSDNISFLSKVGAYIDIDTYRN